MTPQLSRWLVYAAAAFLLTNTAPPFVRSATAGCGCDHPPPAWSLVMPPFASPGKTVTVWADGFAFQVGASYEVDFGDAEATVVAEQDDRLEVAMPEGVPAGPVAIEVEGPGVDHAYASELFTALAPAPIVPEEEGVYAHFGFEAAVTESGTLLVPMNLEQVLDATQFAVIFTNLPLDFGPEDVVFYNADGVDLTLFTLDVDDPTEHQWGSYYGWEVEDDTGFRGRWYDNKVMRPGWGLFRSFSNMLTYWRHEFHTYHEAHQPGGSHEVDENGFHPDGTLHIDHDHVVLAISGLERDWRDPGDASKAEPLEPGSRHVNLLLGVTPSDGPIEPEHVLDATTNGLFTGRIELMRSEQPSAYDVGDEDGHGDWGSHRSFDRDDDGWDHDDRDDDDEDDDEDDDDDDEEDDD